MGWSDDEEKFYHSVSILLLSKNRVGDGPVFLVETLHVVYCLVLTHNLNHRIYVRHQKVSEAIVQEIKTSSEAEELDQLLWELLWKPLDLPRDIRASFKLEGECLELGARSDDLLVGGLVANWTSPVEVEIRHLAVNAETHGQGIGTQLVVELLKRVSRRGYARVRTIARNTSAGFLRKLGFTTAPGEPPEHPLFKKHGITFELLQMNVEQSNGR